MPQRPLSWEVRKREQNGGAGWYGPRGGPMFVIRVLFSPQLKACSTLKQTKVTGDLRALGSPCEAPKKVIQERVCEVVEGASIQSGASH